MIHRLAHRGGRSSQATTHMDESHAASHTEILTTRRVAVKGVLARLARSPNPRGAVMARAIQAVRRTARAVRARLGGGDEAYRSSLVEPEDPEDHLPRLWGRFTWRQSVRCADGAGPHGDIKKIISGPH